jgi:hypothetical protein
LVDSDGCSSDCRSEMIPGGGSPWLNKRECFHEWLAPPVLKRDARGLPVRRLVCTDDDPLCDFGSRTGDQACTFRIALCFNVTEMRRLRRATGLPLCTPTDVERVRLTSSYQAYPLSEIDVPNLDSLESAMAAIGGSGRDSPLGTWGSTCCSRFVTFDPPLTARDLCTDFAEIVVPLRPIGQGSRTGHERIHLTAAPSPLTKGHPRRADRDLIDLRCKPH